MTNRRELPLMKNTKYSLAKSKVAVAIAVGVFFLCVYAFFYPCHLSVIYDNSSNCIQAGSSPGEGNGNGRNLRTNPTIIPDTSVNPRLAKILEKISVGGELIVTLVNSKMKDILEVWITSIRRVGIPNYLVVALDDEIAKFCDSNEMPYYRPDLTGRIDLVAKNGVNKDVSGLKFLILKDFLKLGYSVLSSDVDIVYLQNPFNHLYRDCDVESMTDGHNSMTSYGYIEPFDEPSMGWASKTYSIRIWFYSTGLFYIRPTMASIELLDRVFARVMKKPDAWDQLIFNLELFMPSKPGLAGHHASKRTMDFYLFMNSKVLFRTVRKDAKLIKTKPVAVHVNFHPDKLARMKAIMEFYMDGKPDALEPFPDGSKLVQHIL